MPAVRRVYMSLKRACFSAKTEPLTSCGPDIGVEKGHFISSKTCRRPLSSKRISMKWFYSAPRGQTDRAKERMLLDIFELSWRSRSSQSLPLFSCSLTEHFAILKPQNPPIKVSSLHKILWPTHFVALKLWNVLSGHWFLALFYFTLHKLAPLGIGIRFSGPFPPSQPCMHARAPRLQRGVPVSKVIPSFYLLRPFL